MEIHKMLTFSPDFFKAEERDDFFVSATMKSYWACCMEIINIIDEVCKKYNLRYFADWGTLLGAVRHNGFIPWDDDMDIVMLRPDYEKLLEVLPSELPEGYRLSTPSTNKEHRQFFAGVSNGIVMDVSKAHVSKFYNCPFVATIDIFQLDYLPRDEKLARTIKSMFIIAWNAVQKIKDEAEPYEIEKAVREVEKYFKVKIKRGANMRSQLWELANNLVKSYTEEEGDYLVQWCGFINKGLIFDKKWYEETVMIPFENIMLPAPACYDEVLTVMFGDWRTPVRGGQSHDYPCFKKQLELLRKKVAELKAAEQQK